MLQAAHARPAIRLGTTSSLTPFLCSGPLMLPIRSRRGVCRKFRGVDRYDVVASPGPPALPDPTRSLFRLITHITQSQCIKFKT